LGGAKTFREAWRHYYDDAYGFVYVLDSSEEERLGENRDVLKRLLQEEKVKGKPILMYEIEINSSKDLSNLVFFHLVWRINKIKRKHLIKIQFLKI
jgi:hypothetical protein